MAGIYYYLYSSVGSSPSAPWCGSGVAPSARTRVVPAVVGQCVQHCLEFAGATIDGRGSRNRAAAGGASSPVLCGGPVVAGRGWEREFHSRRRYSDMATSRGAADLFGTVRCSVCVGCMG